MDNDYNLPHLLEITRGEIFLKKKDNNIVVHDTLVPGFIFLILYVVWALLVIYKNPFIHSFDQTIIHLISNNNPVNIAIATKLTVIGNTSTLTIATIVLFIGLLIAKKFSYAFFSAGLMICANGYNWITKHAVERHRPLVHHLFFADGYSFPSGHSVGSATFFGILIILTILLVKNKFWRTTLIIIWIIFPLFIGYTRIFCHVHYPSDVVGGWLEGTTFVLLGFSVLYHSYLKKHN